MKPKHSSSIFMFLLVLTIASLASANVLPAPDGSFVKIFRDSYGVPHIYAETECGMFFGQGFALARDRLVQMEKMRRAACGELAQIAGYWALESDMDVRMFGKTDQELEVVFNELMPEIQNSIQSYSAGINAYLDSMALFPWIYKPQEFYLYNMEIWRPFDCLRITHFKAIGSFTGGFELLRLSELVENGWDWFDENRPINDPTAPTTIHNAVDTHHSKQDWHYSGLLIDPQLGREYADKRSRIRQYRQSMNIPPKFGSYAAMIGPDKSESGCTMLLGCPQMGEPSDEYPNPAMEIEMYCPTIHIGGMTIPGIPGTIIGRTENYTATMTSGHTDVADIYVEFTMDPTYSYYLFNDEWLEFEVFEEIIYAYGTPVPYTHYRTIHGPVVAEDLDNSRVFSLKLSTWNAIESNYECSYNAWQARNFEEFETSLEPYRSSVNFFFCGEDGTLAYRHVGHYNDRTDGVDPRLPHMGDGREEWGGIIPYEELPRADHTDQDYFVNWNNKPVSWWNNGDNVSWVGDNHVTELDNYIGPNPSVTFDYLKGLPEAINTHGTYQQVVEWTTPVNAVNIVPPGQSEFVSLEGEESPHSQDQWQLHLDWEYKEFIFDEGLIALADIDVRPQAPPVIIPAGGGNFEYEANIFNNNDRTIYGDLWIEIVLPNGDRYHPMEAISISVEPGETLTYTPLQYVPGDARWGMYSLEVVLGINPGYAPVADEFSFVKLPGDLTNIHNRGWETTGFGEAETAGEPTVVSATPVPSEFIMHQAYPNPFNSETLISIELPQATSLKVSVYNLLGREVAVLTNELKSAGFHSFTFDATGLSSGIYLIRAETPESLSTSQKVMLLR